MAKYRIPKWSYATGPGSDMVVADNSGLGIVLNVLSKHKRIDINSLLAVQRYGSASYDVRFVMAESIELLGHAINKAYTTND